MGQSLLGILPKLLTTISPSDYLYVGGQKLRILPRPRSAAYLLLPSSGCKITCKCSLLSGDADKLDLAQSQSKANLEAPNELQQSAKDNSARKQGVALTLTVCSLWRENRWHSNSDWLCSECSHQRLHWWVRAHIYSIKSGEQWERNPSYRMDNHPDSSSKINLQSAFPVTPNQSSCLLHRIRWSMVSKAVERSCEVSVVTFPSSIDKIWIFKWIFERVVSIEWNFLCAAWEVFDVFEPLMYWLNRLSPALSKLCRQNWD